VVKDWVGVGDTAAGPDAERCTTGVGRGEAGSGNSAGVHRWIGVPVPSPSITPLGANGDTAWVRSGLAKLGLRHAGRLCGKRLGAVTRTGDSTVR
jgi:hypothetical protein